MTGTKLVVCADDAGLARSTDDAILRCCREGIVRTVSVIAGGPTAEEFLERAAGIEVGLHVNLTEGPALTGAAPTLTDRDGVFRGGKTEAWARLDQFDPDEVAREVAAQWEWLCTRARPRHVNGHNHVHVFRPVREALPESCHVRVPSDPGLPEVITSRVRGGSCHFTGHDFCVDPTERVFLRSVREPWTEFMVHPGTRPGAAFTEAPERDRETDVLCSLALRAALDARGIELACFGDLA